MTKRELLDKLEQWPDATDIAVRANEDGQLHDLRYSHVAAGYDQAIIVLCDGGRKSSMRDYDR